MTVRKKVSTKSPKSDKMISPQVLEKVKKAISTLTDEGASNMENQEDNTKAPEKATKKKPVKKLAKKPAKAVKKVATAKDENMVSLADICKPLKMEPRTARKVLRNNEIEVDGGRWAWKKGSADIKKVEKLLKDYAAGE